MNAAAEAKKKKKKKKDANGPFTVAKTLPHFFIRQ